MALNAYLRNVFFSFLVVSCLLLAAPISKAGNNPLERYFSSNLYEVLGVAREASTSEIRMAGRALMARLHPDRHEGVSAAYLERVNSAFRKVNEAVQVLSDEQRRANYDRLGTTSGGSPQPQQGSYQYSVHVDVAGLTGIAAQIKAGLTVAMSFYSAKASSEKMAQDEQSWLSELSHGDNDRYSKFREAYFNLVGSDAELRFFFTGADPDQQRTLESLYGYGFVLNQLKSAFEKANTDSEAAQIQKNADYISRLMALQLLKRAAMRPKIVSHLGGALTSAAAGIGLALQSAFLLEHGTFEHTALRWMGGGLVILGTLKGLFHLNGDAQFKLFGQEMMNDLHRALGRPLAPEVMDALITGNYENLTRANLCKMALTYNPQMDGDE